MPDNVQITVGLGTFIATDECTVNGEVVQVPLGKVGFGGNDQFTYVSSTAGLPVAQQGTWTVALAAGSAAIGTVGVTALPALPAGSNVIGHVVVDSAPTTAVTGTVAISGTVAVASVGGSVEITNDAGNPIPVSGTVAVTGTFWQATQPVSVAALPALAAGTNSIGTVNAIQAGDSIEIGGTTYAVLRAFANATASGATQVVAATAGKKVRVLKYSLTTSAAVNVYFNTSGGSAISSTKYLAGAGAGLGTSFCPFGQFADTTAGDALQVTLSTIANLGVDAL